MSCPEARVKELVGDPSDRGRVRPADDVQCVHRTDADAYGVPRAPGEVDLFVRRRAADGARVLLLRKLLCSTARPSVGAVTQTSDLCTRHSVAIAQVQAA